MKPQRQTNSEQSALWNGPAGRSWVEVQALLNEVFKPIEDLLIGAVSCGSGSRILDIGCGTGGITLAAARCLGPDGRCTGIDISEPMLAAARANAERENLRAKFVLADAQTHAFGRASFDVLISRFGVMFFEDPVQAFLNLRYASKEGAELRFAAWRSAAENPFMTAAEHAAAPLLPDFQPRRPDEPGQFAFADRQRVFSILEQSGWTGISIQPVDVACTFPEKELLRYLTWMGPVGRILQETDERTRARVVGTVRPCFDPYVHETEVRFTAACWIVCARAPSA